MAMKGSSVALIIPILTLFFFGAANSLSVSVEAASSSSFAKHCMRELVGLFPCLDFVEGKIKNVTPECCSALDAIVKADVMCLCLLFTNNSDPLGLPINQTQAVLLPAQCKIAVPPVSACQHVGDNSSAPPLESHRPDVAGNSSAPPHESYRPVPKGPADQNRGLAPSAIHSPIPPSDTSKALGGAISFIPSIMVTLFIWLRLMA